ncbi:hypothetical protein LCGC14_0330370 [marine sediment metagenome]|uniref:Uncharacterized protein n=1 Tax=marine sediment metagenome TaxID=412755 RepID=A0A0F9TMF3_9ZZZZ
MKFFNKTTATPPNWVRGTLIGSSTQISEGAGARALFSDPLDDKSFESRFDQRLVELMNVKEVSPTDKSLGGSDA